MVKGELEVRLCLLRLCIWMRPYCWCVHLKYRLLRSRIYWNAFHYGQKADWIFAQFGRSQAVKVQTKTSHCYSCRCSPGVLGHCSIVASVT